MNINFGSLPLNDGQKEMIVDWFMSMDKEDLVQEIVDRLDSSDVRAFREMYNEVF